MLIHDVVFKKGCAMPKGSIAFARETLEIERGLYQEKIDFKKDELELFKKDGDTELVELEEKLRDLNDGIARLGGKRTRTRASGKDHRRPIALAKCNNGKSVSWCYQVCPKNKDRSCQLIKFQTRKASKN